MSWGVVKDENGVTKEELAIAWCDSNSGSPQIYFRRFTYTLTELGSINIVSEKLGNFLS